MGKDDPLSTLLSSLAVLWSATTTGLVELILSLSMILSSLMSSASLLSSLMSMASAIGSTPRTAQLISTRPLSWHRRGKQSAEGGCKAAAVVCSSVAVGDDDDRADEAIFNGVD